MTLPDLNPERLAELERIPVEPCNCVPTCLAEDVASGVFRHHKTCRSVRALLQAAGDAHEYEVLFNLQNERMDEATAAWRVAHPGNDLALPDLGTLLSWLLQAAREREECGSPWWACCGCGRCAQDGWKTVVHRTPMEPDEHDMECPDCGSLEIRESAAEALSDMVQHFDALNEARMEESAQLEAVTRERDVWREQCKAKNIGLVERDQLRSTLAQALLVVEAAERIKTPTVGLYTALATFRAKYPKETA